MKLFLYQLRTYRFTILCFCLAVGFFVALSFIKPAKTSAAPAPPQKLVASDDAVWQVTETAITDSQSVSAKAFQTARLNREALTQILSTAPMEYTSAAKRQATVLTLPMPNGTFARFRIEESPIMAAELAARFPEIKTYKGQGIDDPTAMTRFDYTPLGLRAIVLSSAGTWLIEPLSQTDTTNYIAYFNRDLDTDNISVSCLLSEEEIKDAERRGISLGAPASPAFVTGATLRTYRLAVAATAEFTQQYGGGNVNTALTQITSLINQINAIYQREATITFQLIANETSIIFTDAATDGYTNGSPSTMLSENQSRLDSIIGSANYDIGHVFGGITVSPGFLSFSGVAQLGVVCSASNKGRGVSTMGGTPITHSIFVKGVTHEIGHQFSAPHTFNSTTGNCGLSGQRSGANAYEPGSGSTIMAYNTCGSDNIQPQTDLYFHTVSLNQILTHATGSGNCAATTATGNSPPTIPTLSNYPIPANTPFTLTASVSDPNGDAMTHIWEEYDPANSSAAPPHNDDGIRPIFRSFAPSTVLLSRTFPRLQYILNNANVPPQNYTCGSNTCLTGEVLPSTTRTLNFRLTSRDNRAAGGGTANAAMQVSVISTAGPFAVTQPNTAASWSGNSNQTVTWNVANTTAAPVSVANVNILLSTDGGNTFPITLAASTPNDGSETVTIPNNVNSTSRLKVEAVGNIFFDISDTNFSITAPTEVKLISFDAFAYQDGRVLAQWQTGYETRNLGFNLYRSEAGKRTRVNQQLLAGSALTAGNNTVLQAGQPYSWTDNLPSGAGMVTYWLEDVDLSGQSTMHGPFTVAAAPGKAPTLPQAELLMRLGWQQAMQANGTSSVPVQRTAGDSMNAAPTSNQKAARQSVQISGTVQNHLSNQAAVKIAVQDEGYYRILQSELITAGLSKDGDPRFLQMFVSGREIPIAITGEADGRFDATDAVEFYGLGLDSPTTDERVYWLTYGNRPGLRVQQMKPQPATTTAQSFTETIERRDRSTYFAALLNGDKENVFGAVVANQPVEQELTLPGVYPGGQATLEVILQGVTAAAHRVTVQLNGSSLGEVQFTNQENRRQTFAVPLSRLREGVNQVRLTAANSAVDVSLVEAIRLRYQRRFVANNNRLRFTVKGGERVSITGFTAKGVRVFDVTDADAIQELKAETVGGKGGYTVNVTATGSGERRLLAIADTQIAAPTAVKENVISNWRNTANGADFVIFAPRDFFAALEPLRALRESQGYRVAVVDITDVYDEFNFGHKSADSLRDFLAYAKSSWSLAPRYVMFVGDASYDAKNYLGTGSTDAVPTKLLDTALLETGSDDWFADFDDDGIAELAVGRLPVRNAAEVANVVAKLLRYEQAKASDEALLVADANDEFNFEQTSGSLRELLPDGLRIEELRRGQLDAATAKSQLVAALNRGQKLVNYTGHGSLTLWRGNLLTAGEARTLTNNTLPVFVMMNCLNNYFQDATNDSLGEALLKSERGGAVAIWASSGLTAPATQAAMNRELYRLLFAPNAGAEALGEAIRQAKAAINDSDVRRTWILLGDPTMRLR